jgi:hypothetical protein
VYRMCCGCSVTVWFRSRGDGKSGFSVVRVVGVPAERGSGASVAEQAGGGWPRGRREAEGKREGRCGCAGRSGVRLSPKRNRTVSVSHNPPDPPSPTGFRGHEWVLIPAHRGLVRGARRPGGSRPWWPLLLRRGHLEGSSRRRSVLIRRLCGLHHHDVCRVAGLWSTGFATRRAICGSRLAIFRGGRGRSRRRGG